MGSKGTGEANLTLMHRNMSCCFVCVHRLAVLPHASNLRPFLCVCVFHLALDCLVSLLSLLFMHACVCLHLCVCVWTCGFFGFNGSNEINDIIAWCSSLRAETDLNL